MDDSFVVRFTWALCSWQTVTVAAKTSVKPKCRLLWLNNSCKWRITYLISGFIVLYDKSTRNRYHFSVQYAVKMTEQLLCAFSCNSKKIQKMALHFRLINQTKYAALHCTGVWFLALKSSALHFKRCKDLTKIYWDREQYMEGDLICSIPITIHTPLFLLSETVSETK